jgi:hypothetical protein
MKALLRLSPIFVLALALSACGDDETDLPDFATLFPADNEIGSYVEARVLAENEHDQGFNWEAGPYVTTDGQDVEDRIDGAASHFINAGFANFGLEDYTNGTYDIELHIWQMKTPAGATTAMDEATTDTTWTDASLGEAARVQNQNTSSLFTWFIRKGVYIIKVRSKPTQGGAGTRDGSKTDGEAFATAILAEMP